MPAISAAEIVRAITEAISASGEIGQIVSSPRQHPRRFIVTQLNGSFTLTVYAWTLTFGGRKSLPNEYRIQMTGVASPLRLAIDGPTVLLGYEPEMNLFAGFDVERHRRFTAGSPSVQIDKTELKRAETDGLSFTGRAMMR